MVQIRVDVCKEHYKLLKEKAKRFKLTLSQYGGLVLSGYEVVEVKKQEKQRD